MDALRPYAKAVVVVATPSMVIAAALQLPAALGVAMTALAASTIISPTDAKDGVWDGLKGIVLVAVLALVMGLTATGVALFAFGVASSAMWMVLTGAAASLAGGTWAGKTRELFLAWFVKPELPVERPRPWLPPPTPTWVEMAMAYASPPPPPPPPPPPKPLPRKFVFWGGRSFPAYLTDECFYMICAPPGRGKTTLLRMMLKPILEEVRDPRCRSTLIVVDPKCEMYPWIASDWPADSDVPLELFCTSDQRTATLDWSASFPDLTAAATFALALFPKNPHETQPFFGDASRTAVVGCIEALRARLGFWDLRTLLLLLSDPAKMRELIGNEKTTRYIAELLSPKSEETAQNVQMELTSKLSKWRTMAAQLDQVDASKKISLERFLRRPGVLVLQRKLKFAQQQDAMNAMLFQRIAQILDDLPEDPERMRKVYIFVDEAPTLGCIEGLDAMCRELRSRGVVFCFIWQSWANIVDVWKQKADTIQGTLQNYITLGSADFTDAKHVSELIGKTRGYEEQRSQSRSRGTNSSETEGSGDTEGWTDSTTTAASWPGPPGFNPTRTSGRSGGRSRSKSATTGETDQETSGVTWQYFDRDIKSPTDLMRIPLPTEEGGFHGIAYRAGEPEPWDFIYSRALVDSIVHKRNRFIPAYVEWPSHYQIIQEFSRLELDRLGLGDPDSGEGDPPDRTRDEPPGSEDIEETPGLGRDLEQLVGMIDSLEGDWDADDEVDGESREE